MRDVAAFTGFAEAVAFDCLGEDDGRLPLVFDRHFVRRVNFLWVVPAAFETADLVVSQSLGSGQENQVLSAQQSLAAPKHVGQLAAQGQGCRPVPGAELVETILVRAGRPARGFRACRRCV